MEGGKGEREQVNEGEETREEKQIRESWRRREGREIDIRRWGEGEKEEEVRGGERNVKSTWEGKEERR